MKERIEGTNLIDYYKLSDEEKREFHSKGAKTANKNRKKRRKIKEDILIALSAQCPNSEGLTCQEAGVVALMQKLLQGDIQAWNFVRDTIGEKPIDKIEAKVNTKKLDDLQKQLFGDGGNEDTNEDDEDDNE